MSVLLKIEFSPFLVRGLSYYNGSIFEVKSENTEGSLAGGGSYLVNGIQSTGISFGLDRLVIVSKLKTENKKVLIISLNQDKKTIELAEKLRKENISCTIIYGKPSKALEYANAKKINYVIFVGENEIKSGKFKLKDMKSGKENMISEKDLLKKIF